MVSSSSHRRTAVTVPEYLEGERTGEVRHEYVDGEVYAMVGASDRHGLIASALVFALIPAARRGRCQLFTSDMKVRLEIGGQTLFYYPDLVLACDPDDRERYYRTRPCLIVEVLSETTERIDRREKLLAYQTLPSLKEYLLVAQDERHVTVHRRRGGWRAEYFTDGTIPLDCVDEPLAVDAVYADVDLEAQR